MEYNQGVAIIIKMLQPLGMLRMAPDYTLM